MLDFEALKQVNMDHLDFDRVRSLAESLYDDALALFPASQLKQAI